MHPASLDLLDQIAYWSFRAALVIVFLAWLVRHVIHEMKTLIAALRELRQIFDPKQANDPKVIPSASP